MRTPVGHDAQVVHLGLEPEPVPMVTITEDLYRDLLTIAHFVAYDLEGRLGKDEA